MGAVIPLWDRNRGGIRQAEWLLAQASVGPEQARNTLINTLAEAFNRYQTTRRTLDTGGRQIRDQVRVYRGVYERRQTLPGQVSFGDVVTAEQTLSAYVSSYITALGLQWQAVVDVANLLQSEDLFEGCRQLQEVMPLPDLKHLLPPPAPNDSDCDPRAATLGVLRASPCPQGASAPGATEARSAEQVGLSPAPEPGAGWPSAIPRTSAAPSTDAAGTSKRDRP
jgi:cobalt-zinc-cadmium efflux system outer membrane protein